MGVNVKNNLDINTIAVQFDCILYAVNNFEKCNLQANGKEGF